MPDFNRAPDFASTRAIDSDLRTRSVSERNQLPEDSPFEFDEENGLISLRDGWEYDSDLVAFTVEFDGTTTESTVYVDDDAPGESDGAVGDIWLEY
jgi:hypothetical protein